MVLQVVGCDKHTRGLHWRPMPPHKPAAEHPRVIGCSLPPVLYQRLTAIATQQDTTVSQVMRELLVKGLSDRDT